MSPPNPRKRIGSSTKSPQWVMIVGISFLGIAVIFIMALIVASVYGKKVEGSGGFLICALLALVTSISSGFLGGSAAATGRLPLPKLLENPISFGVTGGIAVFVIVLTVTSLLYPNLEAKPPVVIPSPTPFVNSPVITDIKRTKKTDGSYIVAITFQPEPSFSQNKLFVEVATDTEFKQLARSRFLVETPGKGDPIVLSIRKSTYINYWARLVVEAPDGQVLVIGKAVSFELPAA